MRVGMGQLGCGQPWELYGVHIWKIHPGSGNYAERTEIRGVERRGWFSADRGQSGTEYKAATLYTFWT